MLAANIVWEDLAEGRSDVHDCIVIVSVEFFLALPLHASVPSILVPEHHEIFNHWTMSYLMMVVSLLMKFRAIFED